MKGDIGNDYQVSVDRTDFRIFEYRIIFFSHKNKKSALRYEIGLNIITGDIVWVNGSFPAGKYSDITIFRDSLIIFLGPGERVETNDGYIGEAPHNIKCPMSLTNPREMMKIQGRLRSRHKTINRRFKDWRILKQVICHCLVNDEIYYTRL